MFESAAPDHTSDRKFFYETLPVSLAIHALWIGAAIVSFGARLTFPDHPPKMVMSYQLVDGGSGVLPPAPKGEENHPPTPPPKPTAPTTVPKTIPDAAPAPLISSNSEDAKASGKADGEAGGVVTGIAGGILMGDGRIHFGRGGNLPIAALAMDYPRYPEPARRARLEAEVVLRYIVGTDGVVREVVVIEPAPFPMFDEAATEAIRKWRFEPLIYKGEAREVVHEIMISFKLASAARAGS